jgi:DNA-binding XRE family transcriptional regulator
MQNSGNPGWAALAAAFRRARIEAGYPKRAQFARVAGVNDSTLQVIEGRRVNNISEDMLDAVTMKLGWRPGQWRQYLTGTAVDDDAEPVNLAAATDVDLLNELLRRALHRCEDVATA